MNTRLTLRALAASAIDLADRSYLLAPGEEPPAPHLIDSIREYGLLLPPLVLPRQERFIVIAGRKSLATAITLLGWGEIACHVVPAGTSDLAIAFLLLEHSQLGAPLSLAEQSALFTNLAEEHATEDLLPLLGRLGHKPTPHQLEELLALRQLAGEATLALHRGVLTLGGARKLLRLSPTDQVTAATIIAKFRLGGSKQQKFIELATELCRREGGSMEDLLAPFLDRIAGASQDNPPQQAGALLSWLHDRCFPRSGQAQQEFARQVARLNLPDGMQLEHAPAFEEDWLSLSLKFADWQALRKALPDLRRLLAPR